MFSWDLISYPSNPVQLTHAEDEPISPNTLAGVRGDMERRQLVRDQIRQIEEARLERTVSLIQIKLMPPPPHKKRWSQMHNCTPRIPKGAARGAHRGVPTIPAQIATGHIGRIPSSGVSAQIL